MKGEKITVRLVSYFFGLFLMTIGIALSVKSNLGVSPVSSIPYTATCVWGFEMGKATIVFHAVLVLIQIILLRKNFRIINLLQIIVGIIFGYFTTFCNWGVAEIFPGSVSNLFVRVAMILVSTVFIALGIFFYMPANIIPLAGEGVMMAISFVAKIKMHRAKILFDVTMVTVSLVTCIFLLHGMGSVGAGTIMAAILVGINLGVLNKFFGAWRDSLLGIGKEGL